MPSMPTTSTKPRHVGTNSLTFNTSRSFSPTANSNNSPTIRCSDNGPVLHPPRPPKSRNHPSRQSRACSSSLVVTLQLRSNVRLPCRPSTAHALTDRDDSLPEPSVTTPTIHFAATKSSIAQTDRSHAATSTAANESPRAAGELCICADSPGQPQNGIASNATHAPRWCA